MRGRKLTEPYPRISANGAAEPRILAGTLHRRHSNATNYYYRARYYHPTVSRFVSEDPIRFQGGPNFYVYANDTPTRFRDPRGLDYGDINVSWVPIPFIPFGFSGGSDVESVRDLSLHWRRPDGGRSGSPRWIAHLVRRLGPFTRSEHRLPVHRLLGVAVRARTS